MRREEHLQEKLSECARHIEKLRTARRHLANLLPLAVEGLQNLDDIQQSFLDQFLYRFSKLQDTLGEKVFHDYLLLSQEPVKSMTFLDKLNRLEELGFLNRDEWSALRNLRNDISHEYTLNQQMLVDALNEIFDRSETLIAVYEKFAVASRKFRQ
ncbi:hypothetical protein [Hydrogenimonas sp.]